MDHPANTPAHQPALEPVTYFARPGRQAQNSLLHLHSFGGNHRQPAPGQRAPKYDPFKPQLTVSTPIVNRVTVLTLAFALYPTVGQEDKVKLILRAFRAFDRRLNPGLLTIGDLNWLTLNPEGRLKANRCLVFKWLNWLYRETPDLIFLLAALYTEADNNNWSLERLLKVLGKRRLLPNEEQMPELITKVRVIATEHQAQEHLSRLSFLLGTSGTTTFEHLLPSLLGRVAT